MFMSLDPLSISGKLTDKKTEENFEKWRDILNALVTSYNSGATKNFNTSASYAVTVQNGIITNIT